MRKHAYLTAVATAMTALTVLAVNVQAAGPTPSADAIVTYALNDGSTYQTGCFPPCLCPLLVEQPVMGTFKLAPTGSDPLFDYYDVTDVNWRVRFEGASDPNSDLIITGRGSYQIGGEVALQQRLQLELSVGGNPPQRFDSGLTSVDARFPNIAVTISINGMYCYDTVIVVNASPVNAVPYRLTAGSTYQRGCWDPCDCPLFAPQPVSGTFLLVPLRQGPLFNDYAVLDVRWTVQGSSPDGSADGFPAVGWGTYRVGGEFAVQQQMALDLSLDGGPVTHFDSGLVVGGGQFPRIDVTMSVNGFYCYDQVFHIVARPTRPPMSVSNTGNAASPAGAGNARNAGTDVASDPLP